MSTIKKIKKQQTLADIKLRNLVYDNMYDGGGHKQAAGLAFVGDPIKYANKLYKDCVTQIKGKKD